MIEFISIWNPLINRVESEWESDFLRNICESRWNILICWKRRELMESRSATDGVRIR